MTLQKWKALRRWKNRINDEYMKEKGSSSEGGGRSVRYATSVCVCVCVWLEKQCVLVLLEDM